MEPERKGNEMREKRNLMDEDGEHDVGQGGESAGKQVGEREVDDLGKAMDRAFGRSEMG